MLATATEELRPRMAEAVGFTAYVPNPLYVERRAGKGGGGSTAAFRAVFSILSPNSSRLLRLRVEDVRAFGRNAGQWWHTCCFDDIFYYSCVSTYSSSYLSLALSIYPSWNQPICRCTSTNYSSISRKHVSGVRHHNLCLGFVSRM